LLEGTNQIALLNLTAKQELQFSQDLRALVWGRSLVTECLAFIFDLISILD